MRSSRRSRARSRRAPAASAALARTASTGSVPASYRHNTPLGWDLQTHDPTAAANVNGTRIAATSGDPQGLDVSSYQGDADWSTVAADGASASGMVSWILSFSNEYESLTGRWPVIYTTTDWWSPCTGNVGNFSSTNPLFIANYNGSPGALPYAWQVWTIWPPTPEPRHRPLGRVSSGHRRGQRAEALRAGTPPRR